MAHASSVLVLACLVCCRVTACDRLPQARLACVFVVPPPPLCTAASPPSSPPVKAKADIHPAVVAAIERTVRRQAGGGAVAQLSQLGLQPQHHFIEELGAQCRRARALRASCLPLLSTHHQPDRSRLADDATAELQLGGGRLDDLVGCVEERAHRYL
eukprot:CAMPEP_0113252182 /NCGR_PEP_ID=MMETSP0008_2-20120614/12511_1 /TAXON_ID=97485 /ORGANISM="Prymnesium parvum" /LENGTH=156 /DNA_ID=CAMNT_0000100275 /DNA_START=155 /DNA_END=621 /DNA_ORIENTATION=+ /assembly_acc=CAM_ASM_000153